MKMLLRDMTFVELAQILERHAECSSAPHLVDAAVRKRARRNARQNGVWERIGSELDPTRDIPVLKRSLYRQVQRNGNRTRHQAVEAARARELELAALALWLGHPKADLDYLQDILWAYCDDWTWVMAAHEPATNDLGSCIRGARLAEILYALGDQIEEEVKDRVRSEIDRRIFRNVADHENTEFWHTARMNWNHVCNGGIVRAALLETRNSRVLAKLIHPVIQNMTYALDGFTDDGGCEEGAGYWGFGFGHFVQAAYALHCRTGGELNIMDDPRIERIARFPVAAQIEGRYRASFADCGHGGVALLNALQINHFFDIPELYELCPRRESIGGEGEIDARRLNSFSSGELSGPGPLLVADMHSLALYKGERAKGKADGADYELTGLGLVKMRGKPGPAQMTVVAIAGNNGVPHNHNDIGSFMVFKRGRMLLTDPGAPLYNRETFRSRRYEILWCRSLGHSVPLINGREQKAGARYRGELVTEGLNEPGSKKAVIDMSRAYPRGTVKQLVRTLELDARVNSLTIEDVYQFSNEPESLEEAFVTFAKAVVNRKGDAVRIGAARGGATLVAKQRGRFRVKTMVEKPEHTKPGTPPLQRITFLPAELSCECTLRFRLK